MFRIIQDPLSLLMTSRPPELRQPVAHLDGHHHHHHHHHHPHLDSDAVEVVVGGEVEGHVGQHHRVLQHGEHGVHAGLTEGVVPPVAVDRRQDAAEIGHQEPPLEPE